MSFKFSDFEFVKFDPNAIARKLEELGHQWADAQGELEALKVAYEDAKSRSVLTRVETGASATLAREAKYNDDMVCDVGRQLSEAHRKAIACKTSYEAAKCYIEMKRSVLSTERAAMNLR